MGQILKTKLISNNTSHNVKIVNNNDKIDNSIVFDNALYDADITKSNVINSNIDTSLRGVAGEAATIEIGSIETVSSKELASITNSGTSTHAILNFKIPKGSTPSIGSNGNWYLDGEDTGWPAGVSEEAAELLGQINSGDFHLLHSITIGDYIYNGSEDVVIPVYNGESSTLNLKSTATTSLYLESTNNELQMDGS